LKLDKGQTSLTALDNFIADENLLYSNFRIANTKNNICSIEMRFDKSISQNTIHHLIDKLNTLNGISDAELKTPFQH
jgi:hypothetical protein